MKMILSLLFLVSCAQYSFEEGIPSWVSAIRSGEETLKVSNGSKTYYRRLAGSVEYSREQSCSLAITRAEEDIKKEYPHQDKVPYVVEVLYYDVMYRDCAVTVSVQNSVSKQNRDVASVNDLNEDMATDLIQKRSDVANRFALTGMTIQDFEHFSKQKVAMNQENGICSKYFRTESFSIHGTTQVCWKGQYVVGYCTLKDSMCWTKTP